MHTKKLYWCLLAVLLMAPVSCARSASERIERAQKELDQARKEQAERYAPAEYIHAHDILERARTENDKGNRSSAVQLAEQAEKQAQAAIRAAKDNKDKMKDSVKKSIDETIMVIRQTKEEYDNAKKLRVPEGDLAPGSSTVASAETDLKQADKILDSGDVLTARDKVDVAQSKVSGAQQMVRNLVAEKAAPRKQD